MNAFTFSQIPSYFHILAPSECALVGRFGNEFQIEQEAWDLMDFMYDMDAPVSESVRIRDRHVSAVNSDIGYDRGTRFRSKGAGSGISFLKRRVRRTERRVAHQMIQEQL